MLERDFKLFTEGHNNKFLFNIEVLEEVMGCRKKLPVSRLLNANRPKELLL